VVIFDKDSSNLKKGDYIMVQVHDCNRATLQGKIVK
jgi:hypothetical protein